VADDLPTVLNLLYESDARWRTLRAEGEEWSDEERSREAFLRSVRPGAVVGMRGHPGPADRDPRWSVWVRRPGRWRSDFGGPHQHRFLVIADGDRRCSSSPDGRYRIDEQHDRSEGPPGPASFLLRPRGLPAVVDLEVVGRTRAIGRDALILRGRPLPQAPVRGPGIMRGADEVELGVDADRGVLLWFEQRLEGRPYWRVAMTSVAFDEELDDALFSFPEDGTGALPVPPVPSRPLAPRPQLGPPDGVLGQTVPGTTVLARTDSFVIAVDRVVAYPSGVELGVTVRTNDELVFGSFDDTRRRTWSGTAAFPGESLRIDAVFADGNRAVHLVAVNGSGTQTRFDQRFWLEPLPAPGPLGLVVEWPRRNLAETRVDIDATAIVEAAARAEVLWP